ncbi:50S ribosomal protein L16 [Candidatus Woesearchaeota archaeon]|nr:MAG: 50S ribosomal protein L16 [Candidatus Woesearchaeota archaeon]
MAKLKKAVCWRKLERPYTRKSKFRKKNFIRSVPNSKIVKYDMGELNKTFEMTYELRTKVPIQIRHNALESARQACNRWLEKKIGKVGFYFRVRVYPHHVLRENPLAAGAGADRMSTGMAKSFGKTVGIAAQLREGQPIFEVMVNKQHELVAKEALHRAVHKIPCSCTVVKVS